MEERKSKINGDIGVVRSLGFGTYIQAGGITQSGGIVEQIWRSTLKKLRTKEIKNCLILGLGGGSVAKLVRKFWPKAKITGVEIDPIMIELGTRYLGLDKVQVQVQVQDALKFVKKNFNRFDLVIVDLYIGDKFPEKFENEKFLKKLTKNKIVIFNRLYYGEKKKEAVKFGEKLEKVFRRVDLFHPQANLMFLCYN